MPSKTQDGVELGSDATPMQAIATSCDEIQAGVELGVDRMPVEANVTSAANSSEWYGPWSETCASLAARALLAERRAFEHEQKQDACGKRTPGAHRTIAKSKQLQLHADYAALAAAALRAEGLVIPRAPVPRATVQEAAQPHFNPHYADLASAALQAEATALAQEFMNARVPRGKAQGAEPQATAELPTALKISGLHRGVKLEIFREMLDRNFKDRYDFVYVALDFQTGACLGNGVVNFLGPHLAEQARAHFQGLRIQHAFGESVVRAEHNSQHNLQHIIKRYRNSPVMHASVPDEFKPTLLSGGQRVPFPPPTKRLSPPSASLLPRRQAHLSSSPPSGGGAPRGR